MGWSNYKKVYENDTYKVTFTLASYWDAGYNANIRIDNIGDDTIQNWRLGFVFNNEIADIWNAEIDTHLENVYVVKNLGWNQDVASGESIEFGISGNQAFQGFPDDFELIKNSVSVQDGDYAIEYHVDGDWGSGFYGSISVANNTENSLEEWVLEFDFAREITELWNGVIESREGNHYVISKCGV